MQDFTRPDFRHTHNPRWWCQQDGYDRQLFNQREDNDRWPFSIPDAFSLPLPPCIQYPIDIHCMYVLGFVVCSGAQFFCVGFSRSTGALSTAAPAPRVQQEMGA